MRSITEKWLLWVVVWMMSTGFFVGPENLFAGELRAVCDIWAPYQIEGGEEVTGFSTEVVRMVLQRMDGETMALRAFPWKRALMMIKDGEADMLFSANLSESRTEFARYPEEPLAESPWVLWVRKDRGLRFDTLNDLKGRRIGVVRGYSYTEEFRNFIQKHATPDEVTDDRTNFLKLNSGRIDYTVAELGNGYHILRELKFKNIMPITENPIKTDGLYAIFNKDKVDSAFVDRFSDELKRLKSEPAYKSLRVRYFGLDL